MKHQYGILAFLLVVAMVGCSAPRSADQMTSDYYGYNSGAPMKEAATEAPALWSGSAGGVASVDYDMPRMIVYNAQLDMVVNDTDETQKAVGALVESVNGYISNSSSYSYGEGLLRINLTLRVPSESFNSVMSQLRDMAMEVTQESIGTEDVTQEYVDLESRLHALESKAARLEQLMADAEDTEAVLSVYRELSQTQIDIEQTKGRMQYLEQVTGMATIQVSLTPDELSQPVEIGKWRPQGTLKRAVEALIETFQFLVDALIWIVLVVLPVLAIIGAVIYGFIRLLKLIFGKRRRNAKAVESAHSVAQ